MRELLTNVHDKAEEYKGKRLIKLLAIIFVVFIAIGLAVGYVVGKLAPEQEIITKIAEEEPLDSYEGTITFIEPLFHPEDEISYALTDKKGNEIILLKAEDQKLEVSEGHIATVYGKLKKTTAGEDYLLVDKVAIRNVAN